MEAVGAPVACSNDSEEPHVDGFWPAPLPHGRCEVDVAETSNLGILLGTVAHSKAGAPAEVAALRPFCRDPSPHRRNASTCTQPRLEPGLPQSRIHLRQLTLSARASRTPAVRAGRVLAALLWGERVPGPRAAARWRQQIG